MQILTKDNTNSDAVTNELNATDFDIIKNANPSIKLLKIEVNAKKLSGTANKNFDPHLQGNVPFVLGKVNIGNKPVKLLRMGTPTIEPYIGAAEINPEFRGYLQNLKLKSKKHLYISLQNDKPKGWGDESRRNAAIKGLQINFPDNFYAVVLAQDSNFYKQVDINKKDLGPQDANEFKKEFLIEMFGTNTGFYFPDTWKNEPSFKYGLGQLLETLHTTVFSEKEKLSVQEKKDFIEIYYAYLAIFLMNYSEADNANITCKDAIDRAGKLNSLVLKLIMIIQGNANSDSNKRKHRVLTHAPAFFVKAQAIIHDRRARLMSAYSTMTQPAISQRIQAANIFVRKFDKTDPKKDIDLRLIHPNDDIEIK